MHLVANKPEPAFKEFSNLVTNTPPAQIESNIATYQYIVKSNNATDILQCIALAENIVKQGELLLAEATARRDKLVVELGGTIAQV